MSRHRRLPPAALPPVRGGAKLADDLVDVTAHFSKCRRWRYVLTRTWNTNLPPLAVIGLNPSAADEGKDDPTVRRCQCYARRWGFGGLVMLNLFGYRATEPADLKAAADPVGPGNNAALRRETASRRVLVAWGVNGAYRDRAAVVLAMLGHRDLVCLARTKDGSPRHPLYCRAEWLPTAYP